MFLEGGVKEVVSECDPAGLQGVTIPDSGDILKHLTEK